MDGNSTLPDTGAIVEGKYGRYLLKKEIGKGGNGKVYDVEVVEGRAPLQRSRSYVIKIFNPSSTDDEEYRKRSARFVKEIRTVLSIQDSVDGIIPIYDTSIYVDEDSDQLWYLMPEANQFVPQRCSVSKKLEHMLYLGHCIKQLHDMGYAHRDIKPTNLLFFMGRVYLSDFGLIWNAAEIDNNITEINDRLGPRFIRPPELLQIEDNACIDYTKSDVYLFAKTIWMVLKNNKEGFSSVYSRADDEIYIDKDELHLKTAEPLHLLLEAATKHYYWERINIDSCIDYLETQLRIITGDVELRILNAFQFDERAKRLDAVLSPDVKVYEDPVTIMRILSDMSETAKLVFSEPGWDYGPFLFSRANCIQKDLYEIEIMYKNRKIVIELSIVGINSRNMTYEIQMQTYAFDQRPIQVFSQITKALECPEKRVRLSANYLIKMVHM